PPRTTPPAPRRSPRRRTYHRCCPCRLRESSNVPCLMFHPRRTTCLSGKGEARCAYDVARASWLRPRVRLRSTSHAEWFLLFLRGLPSPLPSVAPRQLGDDADRRRGHVRRDAERHVGAKGGDVERR